MLRFQVSSLTFSLLLISAGSSVIYGECSRDYFTSNTAYQLNVDLLYTSLIESSSIYNFKIFEIPATGFSQNDVVFGLFQCQGDLSFSRCRDCVARSVSQLKINCPVSIGGTIQLEGCFVKYDNISFVGLEDKMEAFRSCGPSIGHNSDILINRDDALAYVISGIDGHYFRAAVSGSVQAVAQCEEDLTLSECEDCLLEGRARLTSECKTSSRGAVYVGKCYIRYAHQGILKGRYYNRNSKREREFERDIAGGSLRDTNGDREKERDARRQ
ncbi:hypothetical protein L2E82_30831 [Cichorium intybus]|uniref:Uncharacterized protein n=1 Tax=Cichorium intybus TaxID=13427 RepID=A0ACB9D1F6_CICIN|nr:hypothetical protein L2E82_30831 [Cichorium intybus]